MLEITEEELKKILPPKGPSIEEVKKYLKKYNDEYIVVKCGGSVLANRILFNIDISLMKISNNSLSTKTLPPHLMTMYSSLYFSKYFLTSLIEGPSDGRILLNSSSLISNIKWLF